MSQHRDPSEYGIDAAQLASAVADEIASRSDEREEPALSFVDLLYAVPVADLATRVSLTHLRTVSLAGWLDVSLAMAAITFGWVGHHTAYQQLPKALKRQRVLPQPFIRARFWQFVIEILIIAAYFALGTRAVLPKGQGIAHTDNFWKGACLVAIYLLYLVWDIFDFEMARRLRTRLSQAHAQAAEATIVDEWATKAVRRMSGTLIFLIIFFVLMLVGRNEIHEGHRGHLGRPLTPAEGVAFDAVAIIFLYAYRVFQGRLAELGWRRVFRPGAP